MTDWKAVTDFFNGVIEQAKEPIIDDSNDLIVTVYSPAHGHRGTTLQVVVPRRKVEDFMKSLPTFEAKVWAGDKFCTQCAGPYSGHHEERYGGHWDTCPNRVDPHQDRRLTSMQESSELLTCVFATQEIAEEVMHVMTSHVSEYGEVSVATLKTLVGQSVSYPDQKIGWRSLNNLVVRREIQGPGYQIKFPPLENL